jgi:NAD(P)-dependent dehydrogenase (short-subunit alcohol dehydrogenase family)
LRGGVGYAAFASAKFGVRAVAQSAARELGPRGIHVAHLVIDAGVDTAWVRERIREREGEAALTNNLDPGPADAVGGGCRGLLADLFRSRATPGRSSARSGPLRKNGEAWSMSNSASILAAPTPIWRIW